MRYSPAALLVVICLAATPAKADLVCPKGSLHDFANTQLVWDQYRSRSADYLEKWHRRLATRLKAILDATDFAAQVRTSKDLGKDRTILMQRIFEQGFIAAADIVQAHCVQRPNTEPWSESIKLQRRAEWCRDWGDAHFCSR